MTRTKLRSRVGTMEVTARIPENDAAALRNARKDVEQSWGDEARLEATTAWLDVVTRILLGESQ